MGLCSLKGLKFMIVFDGPDMNRIFKGIVKSMLVSLFEDLVIVLALLFKILALLFEDLD